MASRKDATLVTNPDGSKVPGYIQDGRSYYADGTAIVGGASVVDLSGRTWTKPLDDAAKAVESIANKAGIVVSGAVDAVQTGISRGGGAGRQDVQDWYGSGPIISDTGNQGSSGSGDYSVNMGDIAGSLGLDLENGWLSWLLPLLVVILFLRIILSALRRD
ncbi:MAG: hypothetical protein VB085_08865 [Peptococcaceae bacterium]|nr:hypothetical protein [Peptococcaceae bacterium]